MKKWAGLAGALVVVVSLVVVTVMAGSQSSRAKGPVVLVSPPVTSGPTPVRPPGTSSPTPVSPAASSSTAKTAPPATYPPGPPCHFGTDVTGAPTGAASSVHLTGACTGDIVATFTCSAAIDDLYASIRAPLDASHGVYLTMNVESYKGPGDYPDGQAFIQVTGPTGAETWSNRTLDVRVGPNQSIRIVPADLAADPGTGSSGITNLSGNVGCGS